MTPFWLTAFLDFADADFERGVRFWRDVTGFTVSAPRGGSSEFATLVPPDGDDYLRVQRLGTGRSRLHLDVHVTDPRAAADRAVSLGAEEVCDVGHVVLRSPGGVTFCFVTHPSSSRPTPVAWPGGHRSMVYQVCLDLPRASYDAEARFWAAVLAADPEVLPRRPEFSWLRPGRQLALDVLMQRLDRVSGPAGLHLDLGTDVREREVARHVALGAEASVVEEFWTVMRDPVGTTYCITDRDPATGRLV
ncbi:MAG: VOC family protein [Nocardioidaceae bacterium]